MYKIIFSFFILFLSFNSNAQYSSEGDLISRFRPGSMWYFTGLRPAVEEKVRKYDRLMVDLTYNDWNGDQKIFQNKWASIGVNTNLMFDIPITKGNTVSFGTGISHSLFRINHMNNFIVDSTKTYTTIFTDASSGLIPSKRFLCGNSISLPIEFRFRTKGWKHFKVHLGGKIGYQLNLYSKTVFEGQDGKYLEKNFDFPDVNRLIYSTHIRIGMRNWSIYGSYNLNTLFANRLSSQLNLVQMGLTISLF